MHANRKFDMLARSAIIKGEKPNRGVEAVQAPTPHQMNRVVGFLSDGRKVVVAQRPGKGGMDFTKLMGGKVYSVAADAMSPVYEKDKDGNVTRTQKTEEGLPLYSASGFYSMSSKEYPALRSFGSFVHLLEGGEQLLLVTPEQLSARKTLALHSELDWDIAAVPEILAMLSAEHNLMSEFDADMNKKRRRGIERAKEEAEDASDKYGGVDFKECSVSKKDGNPFVLCAWRDADGDLHAAVVLRETASIGKDGRVIRTYLSAEEGLQHFTSKPAFAALTQAMAGGVEIGLVQGHLMRTSVSQRRKVENLLANPPEKNLYGDAPFLLGALKGWVKGFVTCMHSQHPNFPQADYDSHSYVAACRQAEMGMNKKPGGGWEPPQAPGYALAELLAEPLTEAVAA